MAHVLLCWEFGAGHGHVKRLRALGQRLRNRGHQVSYALQRVDTETMGVELAGDVWQAPITPRLLANTRRGDARMPATMGDILARLGYESADLMAGLLRAWDRLLTAVRPDLLIADYAPTALLAAAGRVPRLACGTGFDLPPSEMVEYPSLSGQPTAYPEGDVLGAINAALRRNDRAALDRLPQVFAAETSMPAVFRELDPYRQQRTGALYPPIVPEPMPKVPNGTGEEVFAYLHEYVPPDSALFAGLASSGLPIRVYVTNVGDEYRSRLASRGFKVEHRAVAFAEIAARSRLLLSHGSLGFVCSGLLAGLPHVVCHHDMEKLQNGLRITELGLGGYVPLQAIQAEPFALSLRQVYSSDAMTARARAAAPDFQARMTVDYADVAVAEAESLIFGQ